MMGNEADYSDAFDAGADWQLQRCVDILDQVMRLKTSLKRDTVPLKALVTIKEMMECGE
jgi:hypothetical protein